MKVPFNIFFISLSFITLALMSCDPAKKYAVQLSSIDSCMTVLDSIEQVYNGIEFDSLDYMVKHVEQNESKFKKYYNSDTVDMLLGSYMNNCKGVRKTLKDVKSKEITFKNEIAALDTQFINLKTDILNDVLSEEEIEKFLNEEKVALKNLSQNFASFNENQKIQSGVFYMASPYVDAYIERLNIPKEDVEVLEP